MIYLSIFFVFKSTLRALFSEKDTGLLGVGNGVGGGAGVGLEAVEGDLQGVAERVVVQHAP